MIEAISNTLMAEFKNCKITQLWTHGFRAHATTTDMSAEFEFNESDVTISTYVYHAQTFALWTVSKDVVEYSDPRLITVVRGVFRLIHTPVSSGAGFEPPRTYSAVVR